MPKKTWIKVKRGLLQPKHRLALGIRIWLYLYMLDITDWETGTILEWRDKSAANEIEMPLDTIRKQRRQLEEDGYIKTSQDQHSQKITILKWVDPRKYSGEVLNESGQNWPPTDLATEKPVPLDVGVSKTHHPDASESQGGHQGCHQGGHQGIEQLATPSIKPHTTDHKSKVLNADDMKKRVRATMKKQGFWPALSGQLPEAERIDLVAFSEELCPYIETLCIMFDLRPPKNKSKIKDWINGGQLLKDACAEFGPSLIVTVYENYSKGLQAGALKLTISRPGSIVELCRSTAGELRRAKKELTPDELVDSEEARLKRLRGKTARERELEDPN